MCHKSKIMPHIICVLMCKRVHVQVKAMWLVKVAMPWNVHGFPYCRRNTLGVIVFEFDRKKLHLVKERRDTRTWCGWGYYQQMEHKEVQPPILHAQ